ncbi:N-acetylmuramoyl-L-alanine amidase [Chitinophaga jiangningensis]|uniref:N-acetylmuramoyl-L-alanine amidase n=1 Tax=Chitinophaga jiangningensis TaxID=1419482 RepID=A0A1M7HP74_9BACT|nr:N-acetylmuramoyl-L-alanine amidase [Chitinophaga jiangningensis]SHM29917.1 N-acetylmuramoyl-L-alanine amidase [Chitinophaga jiangningensis]
MKQLVSILASIIAVLVFPTLALSQASIRLNQPSRDQNNVSNGKQFIAGRTCIGCKLTINNDSVLVYPTGTFAVKKELPQGKSTFVLNAQDSTGTTYTKTITYYYNPAPAPKATSTFRIDFIDISPKGNLELADGDTIRVKMKGYPGTKASWFNGEALTELPPSQSSGVPGYYVGYHVITEADSLLNGKINVTLRNGSTTTLASPNRYRYMKTDKILTGRTIDNMTYLTSTTEGDRLGPNKLGYLDKDVLLQIVGKQGDYYKVRLANKKNAYIPEGYLDTDIPQEGIPVSVISNAAIWGDEKYDYVQIELSDRMPYISTQQNDPGKIIIDVYGAYAEQRISNALQNAREISQVTWGQPAPDVFRMTLSLKHNVWGYKMYYEGNKLTVRVKRIPENLALSNMTIAIDPGHGGNNPGGTGLAGVVEKHMTLAISLMLKNAFEKEGAKVLITRTTDQFVNNEERLSFYRQVDPDLLLSIHFNSSANPVDIYGTATYYRHPFCEPFSTAIHKRLLETGLSDFGNNGNFNFILNNPTEFPDVLVETLFLSNPGDEAAILDPEFQQLLIQKIVQGTKDYIQEVKR